jgi:Electron transfer DM13
MKYPFLFLTTVVLIVASCRKDKSPTNPIDDRADTTINSQVKLGMFMNGPYGSVTGNAKIYKMNNVYTLALENVVISNGPDLHVYISKEVQPVNYIDLGRLQSTMGNQLYAIPGNPDFSEYKYALIHCQRYNHLFGSAVLR